MSDAINPDHYKRLPVEAIEIIKAAIDGAPSNQDAYLHGQVLKYVLRCWNKNGIEDLKKAKWYLDRLIGSLESDEQQKAADLQSLKNHPFGKLRQPAWTPKIGDWVRIKNIDPREAWMPEMDKYDGKIVQVEEFDGRSIVHDEWCFLFDWLEPAEQPAIKQSLTTEPPDGWRWLRMGEPIRKGDKPKNGDAVPSFWIGTPCCNNQFILRRNKFEVGEKVVHGNCKSLSISVVGNILGDGWVDLVRDEVSTAYHVKDLAPYIEETK